jgi:hypothetical protein
MKTIIAFLLLTSTVHAGLESMGEKGINALGLERPDNNNPLTGAGAKIGQIETERPGKNGVDMAGNYNSFVNPAAVYLFDQGPDPDDDLRVPPQPGHAPRSGQCDDFIPYDGAWSGSGRVSLFLCR